MTHLFAHVGSVFLLALAIVAASVGLALVFETLDSYYRLPKWLHRGVEYLSIGLFVWDAILVLGASGILTIRLLMSLASHKEKAEDKIRGTDDERFVRY